MTPTEAKAAGLQLVPHHRLRRWERLVERVTDARRFGRCGRQRIGYERLTPGYGSFSVGTPVTREVWTDRVWVRP